MFKLLEITLSARRHYLDVLSLTMFLTVENIVLPFWKLLAFACQIVILETLASFNVDFKRRTCPSARCAAAANAIDSDTDIFDRCSVSVNMIN